MKRSHYIAAGIAASLTLGLATVAFAQPAPGFGPGPCAFYGAQPGTGAGYGPGWRMGAGPAMGPGWRMAFAGRMGPGFGGPAFGNQLMTPEERTALIEKMRNAKTPEERQQIAAANHAEMQNRAQEKGIALPEQRGPRAGFGPNFAPPFAAPAR